MRISTLFIVIALVCTLSMTGCGTTIHFGPDGIIVIPPPDPILIPVSTK
jgi:hypothetical protein